MGVPLHVLLVEDSEDDEVLLMRELKKGGYEPTIERIETESAMKKALSGKDYDIVVSDYLMPSFNGLDALRTLQKIRTDLPFIVVSGKIGEDFAVEMMKAGANDYIMKGNLARLNQAIVRELKEAENRREKEKMESDLYDSHAELKKQALGLQEMNKKLAIEVSERKKAEIEERKSRDYLQNIIDSATEVVISFDENNRVTTWNKRVEQLTGFKNEEIINRTASKLPVFENLKELKDDLTDGRGKINRNIEMHLLTKDNTKKIILGSSTPISGDDGKGLGVLFVGRDVTMDLDTHGKLLAGNSYLVPDKDMRSGIKLFVDLARINYKGLLIARSNPSAIKDMVPKSPGIRIVLLGHGERNGYELVDDLLKIEKAVDEFTSKNKEAIVLIDGTHYLLTRFTFPKLIDALFRINDIVSENKAILLIRLDPQFFDKSQMAIIENEFQTIPSQKIDDLIIEDELYDVLRFIRDQNKDNAMVSFKKVMSKFKIAYQTAAKRLQDLEDDGLIFTKKYGKMRAVYITEKGKNLLMKRQMA